MDQSKFETLIRLLSATSSRRAALGALVAAGVGRSLAVAEARNTHRRTRRRRTKGRRPERVAAQESCALPGPSSSLSGCNFNNQDLSGIDLSSSSMRGTTFRGANLCGADLSSSQLKDADFRGFAGPDNPTNLLRADLSSSGCKGTRFSTRTLYCQTRMCNGTINNRDCPDGVDPRDVCCLDVDCGPGRVCTTGLCVACGDVCPGGCAFSSLADAVSGTPVGGTIRLCRGTYPVRNVLIDKDLTIVGAGAEAGGTVLDAEGVTRALRVQSGVRGAPSTMTVEMRDLVVTGGATGQGGGVLNAGTLSLRNVTVRGNFAGTVGGGIDNLGTMTLGSGVRVEDNRCDLHGGGIRNAGTLTLEDGCLVTGNTALFEGGGIQSIGNGPTTLKAGSSVERNTAAVGGGIYRIGAMAVTLEPGSVVANNTPDNCEPTIGTCS